jgi:hypothetical protein
VVKAASRSSNRDLKCFLSNGMSATPLGGLKQTGGSPVHEELVFAATSNDALNPFKLCVVHRSQLDNEHNTTAGLPEDRGKCLLPAAWDDAAAASSHPVSI